MSTTSFYVLFESAAGYALFSILESDEISNLVAEVQSGHSDFSKFQRIVKMISFLPFLTAESALENINAISEHELTEELKVPHLHFYASSLFPLSLFFKTIFQRARNQPLSLLEWLGFSPPSSFTSSFPTQIEPTIAQAIQENLGVQCRSDETVREILRAIRTHFTKFVKVLGDGRLEQSQLGLGHSYSRSKVKFNPGRADNMIIQSIALLDQLDKDLNTFAMRVREWYGWHFPELKNIVRDNYLYARCAAFIQVLPPSFSLSLSLWLSVDSCLSSGQVHSL
jgi:nucleolar protein 56